MWSVGMRENGCKDYIRRRRKEMMWVVVGEKSEVIRYSDLCLGDGECK